MEVVFNGGFYAQVLRPVGRNIEVHLKDFLLGILLRQTNGQRCLGNFSIDCLRCVVCQIFNHLLGYGAGTTHYRTCM